jgi:hypothetical protein
MAPNTSNFEASCRAIISLIATRYPISNSKITVGPEGKTILRIANLALQLQPLTDASTYIVDMRQGRLQTILQNLATEAPGARAHSQGVYWSFIEVDRSPDSEPVDADPGSVISIGPDGNMIGYNDKVVKLETIIEGATVQMDMREERQQRFLEQLAGHPKGSKASYRGLWWRFE